MKLTIARYASSRAYARDHYLTNYRWVIRSKR